MQTEDPNLALTPIWPEEVQGLLNRAQEVLRASDYAKGLPMITAAKNVDPNNANVVAAVKGTKNTIAGPSR